MYKAKKPYRINILQEEHIIMSQKKISDILINWELENEKMQMLFTEKLGK